jgi:hypothetical protein
VVGAEVLARGEELALVLGALGRVEPPPGGIDLEERVLHEVTVAHGEARIRGAHLVLFGT